MKLSLRSSLSVAAVAALLAAPAAFAQNATTTPVGAFTANITASPSGTSHAVTFIAPPLIQTPSVTGATFGKISSITSNTLTLSNATWTAGQLAQATSPNYVLVTSGNNEGLLFRVTANTADTLTLDTLGLNLTTLGFSVGESGDSFKLILGDTLVGLLGTPVDGVIGGNLTQFAAGLTDKIVTTDTSGVTRTFYYDTEFNQWRRSGTGVNQNNLPISPASGVVYYRLGTSPISITSTGEVPTTKLRMPVPSSTTFYARFFPTDGLLSDIPFQTLPDWRSTNDPGVTIATADKIVAVDNSGIVRQFYHDGANWRRSGTGVSQNNVAFKAGTCVYTIRFNLPTTGFVNINTPYNLN